MMPKSNRLCALYKSAHRVHTEGTCLGASSMTLWKKRISKTGTLQQLHRYLHLTLHCLYKNILSAVVAGVVSHSLHLWFHLPFHLHHLNPLHHPCIQRCSVIGNLHLPCIKTSDLFVFSTVAKSHMTLNVAALYSGRVASNS